MAGAANATPVGARVAAPQPCHCHPEGAILWDVPQGHPAPVLSGGGAAGGDDGVADPVCCYFTPIFPLESVGRGGRVEALVGDGASQSSCQEPGAVQAAAHGLWGTETRVWLLPDRQQNPSTAPLGHGSGSEQHQGTPGSENLFWVCLPSLSAPGVTEPLAQRPSMPLTGPPSPGVKGQVMLFYTTSIQTSISEG